MARKTKTNLTFQVTLRDLEGVKIPDARAFIKKGLLLAAAELVESESDSPIQNIQLDLVTIHLTNKETSYA